MTSQSDIPILLTPLLSFFVFIAARCGYLTLVVGGSKNGEKGNEEESTIQQTDEHYRHKKCSKLSVCQHCGWVHHKT